MNSFKNVKRTVKTVVMAETGGEYILPNDKPDVRRIVHVLAKTKKNGCFLDDQSVTAEAEIKFSILYSGDDGELHSVSYTAPVRAKYQLKDGQKGDTAISEFLPPDTQIRLSNPRKFSIKSRTPVSIFVYRREETEPYIEGVQDKGLQFYEKTGVTYSVSCASDNNIPYSCDVRIPDDLPEPESVLSACAETYIPSVTPSDGKADISFPVEILFIYKPADGAPASFRYKTEINHEMYADDVTAGSVCKANVCISDITYSLTTDTAGEMRVIETDITYDAELLYETADNGVYISDMYSTEYESTATVGDITLRRALPAYSTHFSVSGSAENESGGEVIAATASCDKYGLTNDNGTTVFDGELGVYLIKKNGADYEGQTVNVPVRSVIQYPFTDDDEINVTVKTGLPAARCDNGKIYIDTEVYLLINGTEYETVKSVMTFKVSDKPVNKEKISLRLYRPSPDEEPWDVAKRYKVSLDDLRKANENNSKKIYIIP